MTWMLTHSGRHIDFADPQPDQIFIEDIIVGLSREGRFANQSRFHYTVAQHSCFVADLCPQNELEALLHDAHEAYCRDLPSPLKKLLPDYHYIATKLDQVIRLKYGLPLELDPKVRMADLVALATERRDVIIPDGRDWNLPALAHPTKHTRVEWSEHMAYRTFGERLRKLL